MDSIHPARRAFALVVLAVQLMSCSPAASGSPSAGSSAAASSVSPSTDSSPQVSSSASAGVTIAFTKTTLKPKHWGDPDFRLKAVATPAAKVAYAAAGSCTVKADGTVHLTGTGTCTITASTTTGLAASTSLAFAVAAAQPVIAFKSVTIRYSRPFSYILKASSDPAVPIAFKLIPTANGTQCRLSTGKLTLVPDPGDPPSQPNLPTSCLVEARAAKASDDYTDPEPIRATIKVDYPDWSVDARSPGTVTWDPANPTVTVTIRESSGDTLGIDVSQIDGAYPCDVQSVSPSAEAGVPAGTTTFKAVIALASPPPAGYICKMQATALPPDWQDPNAGDHDTFTITVVK